MPMRCTGGWLCSGNNRSGASTPAKRPSASSSAARSSARRSMERSSGNHYFDSPTQRSGQGSPRRSLDRNPWS